MLLMIPVHRNPFVFPFRHWLVNVHVTTLLLALEIRCCFWEQKHSMF